MAYTPSGTIAFYRVPWKSDYKDVRLFTSKTEESNYFSSPLRVEQNYTYIRDKQAIKVNANKEAMEQYNYIRYMNENFSLKWFYAFITGVEYINQNACYVYFEQDIYTTWWDCFSIKSAFVEREHTNNDSDAYNTETEHITVNKYIQDFIGYGVNFTPNSVGTGLDDTGARIVVANINTPYVQFEDKSKETASGARDFVLRSTFDAMYSSVINGANTGISYAVFKSLTAYNDFVSVMNLSGQTDSIISVFCMNAVVFDRIFDIVDPQTFPSTGILFNPYQHIGEVAFYDRGGTTELFKKRYAQWFISGVKTSDTIIDTFSIADVAGYEPRNRKIFHYPFCKWVIDGQNGNSIDILPQLLQFSTSVSVFSDIALDTAATARLIPQHYAVSSTIGASADALHQNLNNSIAVEASYSIPFEKDNAMIWKALNGNVSAAQIKNARDKINLDILMGSIDAASALASGMLNLAIAPVNIKGIAAASNATRGITGAIGAGRQTASEATDAVRAVARDEMQLAELEANLADKCNLPSQTMNMTVDNAYVAQHNMMKVTVRHMCPPLSEVKKYDDYLSKYGYATNMFKTPNLTGRTNWNYVKTTEITIAPVAQNSYAPTDTELRFIEDIFNKGVTFWHINDVGNYGDYTNEIVGDTNGK